MSDTKNIPSTIVAETESDAGHLAIFPNAAIVAMEVKGRGAVASGFYKAGSLVEKCPVIVFTPRESPFIYQTILSSYVFQWMPAGYTALALGAGSLYNHATEPNTRFEIDTNEKVIRFYALTDINEGDEITFSYNANS